MLVSTYHMATKNKIPKMAGLVARSRLLTKLKIPKA